MTRRETLKVANHRRSSVRRELLGHGVKFTEDSGTFSTAFIITAEAFIIDTLKASIRGKWN